MLLSRPKTSVSDFNGADTAPALGVVPCRAVGDPEFLRDPLDRHTSRVKLGDPAPRRLRDRRSAGALALRLGPGHPRLDALADERALELGQVGHHAEHELALRRGRVHVLLVADERYAPRLELAERVDQRPGGAGEAVVAPDQHDIELALTRGLEEPLVPRPRLGGARGVVDELADDAEAAALGVLAQGPELGLGVLAAILGRDPGVQAGAEVLVGSQCHEGYQEGCRSPVPEKPCFSRAG